MLGLIFTLAGMLLFMLAVACMDFVIMLQNEIRHFHQHFGHDQFIYPDHVCGHASHEFNK